MARSVGLVLDLSCTGFIAVCETEGMPIVKQWRPALMRHDDLGDWVATCLSSAQSDFSNLHWIAVGVGPGSFTGLRIAMAFAQGLAMPKALPLYGFNSFAPLLLAAKTKENAVAVLPSNAGRFYASTGITDLGKVVTAAEILNLDQIGKTLLLPCELPAFIPLQVGFKKIEVIQDQWNVLAVYAHAKTSGYDATKAYYLTLPAAELNLKSA